MKSVLISIQPYYVFLIIARLMGWNIPQEKTVEVRKSYPKDSAWNKVVHIYCSKNRKSFNRIPTEYQPFMKKLLGKVVGRFVCDKIDEYSYEVIACAKFEVNGAFEEESLRYNAGACLDSEKMYDYSNGRTLYGWHISQLKIYDTPKELGEFRKQYERDSEGFIKCGYKSCPHVKENGHYKYNCTEECPDLAQRYKITRPPQSWCYIEDNI